jgi:hypothetical protein
MPGPAFDERYDPRFQRGYDGGADASAGGASDASVDAGAAHGGPGARSVGDRDASTAHAAGAPAEGGRDAATVAGSARGASSGPEASPDSGVDADLDAAPEPDAAPDPEAESSEARAWLGAAFALCALAVGVALAWLWSGYSDAGYFTGYSRRTAWDEVRWMAATSMLEIGLLGAVVTAAWLAMRQALRVEREQWWRSPAVVGLGAAVVAGVLVLAWVGSGPSQSSVWTGDPASWTDERRFEVAFAQLGASLVGPVAAAALAAALGVVLVGARVAMGRRA